MERLLGILRELKVLAVVAVIVGAVWQYARAQRLEQQSEGIKYWPSIVDTSTDPRGAVVVTDSSDVADE